MYDLTSGKNKDKKSEHLDLPLEAREAFDRLKAACLQAPILAFPDFGKPFLLETDASGKGLGAVLLQKQSDGRYHPIAYASRIMTETEQRYHSNKEEFLALKWAVTEQFHEYLSPYGKNRREFVVRMDNNPLTYIFSLANLDAAGQRWVAQLASYNFALEYQKGKDNMVADFLSCLDDHLPPGEVQDYLNKIPYPGVKAVLDNAITPLNERVEQGVRPDPDNQEAGPEVTVGVRPARLATTNITNWKLEQQEDPVLYQAVKHRKASRETFKEALLKVTDRKAVSAYAKSKDQLVMKNGPCISSPNKDRPRRLCFSSLFLRSIGMQLLTGAIGRQPIKARADPYLSCKNDSGGLAWLATSGNASENAVVARSLRPLHQWPH